MSRNHGRSYRARFPLAVALAAATAAIIAVPLGSANTATPTTSHSTWSYVSGSSGPVRVVVTGDWNWVTQSCKVGGGVSSTDVKGHYAIGYAGSWNDSTTPYTLTGKATDGSSVTLHVGSQMDQAIVDYCAGTTAANPYPTGTFRISHEYPSLAAFQAAVPNGHVCVNAYDIHKSDPTSNDWNPGKNGDNTLQAHQYVSSAMCSTAQAAGQQPDLAIVKYERVGETGDFVRGPVSGKVGQVVYYEMVVTNSGNTDLVVTLSDPRCDSGTLTPTSAATLAPGASATYYCSHTLRSGDVPRFINTATASGQSASASSTVSASSSVLAKVSAVKAARHAKRVTRRARPARAVVRRASFTG